MNQTPRQRVVRSYELRRWGRGIFSATIVTFVVAIANTLFPFANSTLLLSVDVFITTLGVYIGTTAPPNI